MAKALRKLISGSKKAAHADANPQIHPWGVLDALGIHPAATFPEYDIGCGLKAQLVVITPEFASKSLANRGPCQRPIKKEHFASLKRSLVKCHYHLSGQPIIFDEDGFLVDGQHRLSAVVETGIATISLVIRGISRDAFPAIDNGVKRSNGDVVGALGYKYSNSLSASAILMHRFEVDAWKGNFVLSPFEIEDILRRHPGLNEGVQFARQAARICRSPAVAIFGFYIFSRIHAEAARNFFDGLISGANLPKGSPILAFQRRHHVNLGNVPQTALLFKAWNAFRSGAPRFALRWNPEDEFPRPI